MKRDLELIRKIVLKMEDAPTGWAPDLKIEGYSDAKIAYHCYLVADAGLAKGHDVTTAGSSGPEWMLSYLTWAGHEFAEAARDEGRWKQALGVVKEKGGAVTIAVLTELLTSLMKRAFGIP